jgi:hypothetical protein
VIGVSCNATARLPLKTGHGGHAASCVAGTPSTSSAGS